MLVQIKMENKNAFSALLSPELLIRLGEEEDLFGIGVVGEENDPPCAALVFQNDLENGHVISNLRWLYVREDVRQCGIATALFYEYLRLLHEDDEMQRLTVDAIRTDVPMGEEYNLLCNVLEDFGFSFSLTERFELNETLGSLKERDEILISSVKNVQPLSSITQKQFVTGLTHYAQEHDIGDRVLPLIKECYDEDISMVCIKDRLPEAFLLIRAYLPEMLDIVFLRAHQSSELMTIPMLLSASFRAALKKYPEDTVVHAVCHTESMARFVFHHFPQARPILVRRGYLTGGE